MQQFYRLLPRRVKSDRLLGLTDIAIKALPIPTTGQKTYFDDQLPGFGVRVSQGGYRSFVVMFGPKRQLHTLGRYPTTSLKDARKGAMSYLSRTTHSAPLLDGKMRVTV